MDNYRSILQSISVGKEDKPQRSMTNEEAEKLFETVRER